MNPTFIAVIIFGLSNLGALIFIIGGFQARITNLEAWKEKAGSEIGDSISRVSKLEGRMGV